MDVMDNLYFSLKNANEVIIFERLLCDYMKEKLGFSIEHISLVDAFNKLERHEDGGKIFASLLDIQINNVLLQCDIRAVGDIWNKLEREKRNTGSILDSKDNFFDKMDIHRYSSSFIFRYRALGDKIMGLYILVISPNDYEAFISGKSRRNQFKKIMSKVPHFPAVVINEIDEVLTDFDDKFRTAEAHGTGKLRKISLSMEPFHKNELALFIDFANVMNRMIISAGDMIKSMPRF